MHLMLTGCLLFVDISDVAGAEKLQVPTQVWLYVLPFGWDDVEADLCQTLQHSVPSPILGSGHSEVQLAPGLHPVWFSR